MPSPPHISSSLYFWNSQQQLSFDRHCPPLCSHLPFLSLVHCFHSETLFSPFDNKRVSRTRGSFLSVSKLCSFSFSLIRKGCSHSIRRSSNSFWALLKNASAISGRAVQVLLSVPYEHLSLCIPYYMNVIPTNLKVRCH